MAAERSLNIGCQRRVWNIHANFISGRRISRFGLRLSLAFAGNRDGRGPLQPLANFTTNPAGSAIVDAAGPIRQLVDNAAPTQKRFLVIAERDGDKSDSIVQIETP